MSFYYHIKVAETWGKALNKIPPGSKVVFQFPVRSHSIFMNGVIRKLNKRNIQTIAIIHDLEYLRNTIFSATAKKTGQRLKMEEISALKDSFARNTNELQSDTNEKISMLEQHILYFQALQ